MILGIETASSILSVAIADRGRILTSLLVNRGNAHDELLASLIEQSFRLAAITGGDLSGVAVSEGPGSFTGLRIGMAAAKGLALSLSIPLIAVPTFDAIAARVAAGASSKTPDELAVVFDARRDAVYLAVYRLQNGQAIAKTQVSAMSLADAEKSLPADIRLAGDGAAVMQKAFPGRYHVVPRPELHCHAEDIALLGARMIAKGVLTDLADCEPKYIRGFDVKPSKPLFG